MSATSAQVLIAGGGPAGAAVATHLARRGREILLIEQSTAAHDKVCGEFLSHEAVTALERLGVDLARLGAVPIHAVRLCAKKEIAACDLPFAAASLSRRALDDALLAHAAEAGATVLRGRRVDSLTAHSGPWTAELSDGGSFSAPAAMLATGKHDLGGHRRPRGAQNDLVAFKMYFRLGPAQQHALEGWIELFLFPGGYGGLQLAENGAANLCLLVQRRRLRSCGPAWPALLGHLCESSPPLAARLDGASPMWAKPLALSSIPYGLLLARSEPGLWRLGDQAAVIPSFSGDGISIALHSAERAAGSLLAGQSSTEFAARLHNELRGQVGCATAVARMLVGVPMLAQAARLWPPILRLIAARTRILSYELPPPQSSAASRV